MHKKKSFTNKPAASDPKEGQQHMGTISMKTLRECISYETLKLNKNHNMMFGGRNKTKEWCGTYIDKVLSCCNCIDKTKMEIMFGMQL